MKVIFLDIDGVINDCHHREVLINPLFVNNLKKVIDRTGAKVVITSSRRDKSLVNDHLVSNSLLYNKFVEPLSRLGLEVYDYTPIIEVEKEEEERKIEIEEYLRTHPEVEEYVIIEDDYVMARLFDHQIFIEYSDGFVEEYIEPAINILNGNLGFYPKTYDRSETFDERLRRLFPSLFTFPEDDPEEFEDEPLDYDFIEGKTWEDVEKELFKSIRDLYK